MLKAIVFAGVLIVSASALAQDAPDASSATAQPAAAEGQGTQPAPTATPAAAVQVAQAVNESPLPGQAAPAADPGGVKRLSGMSILGNEEAPKSLVIVPWKSSQLGDEVGIRNDLDDRALPVDREVFMREVHYFDLRSGGSP